MNFQHKQRAFHSHVPTLHASRLFWPDFNDSFLCSAAPLDTLQEQKSWGNAKSDFSCHLDYGWVGALGRTITGNEEMRKSCPSPSARFLQGKGVATGVRQVRNRPSKNQPVTKNSVSLGWFSVLFWPLEGITSFRNRCYCNQLGTRKGECNLSACQC